MLPALGEELGAVWTAEGDQRLGVGRGGVERDFHEQAADGVSRPRSGYFDLYLGGCVRLVTGGCLAEGTVAFRGDAVLGGADADAVRAPGLDADDLVAVPYLEYAAVVAEADHAEVTRPNVECVHARWRAFG